MQVSLGDSGLPQVAAAPKEMLTVFLNSNGTPVRVRINFSSLSMMQECWRKVELSLLRGLRAKLESPATLFGSAIHKALEVYYLADRTERNLPSQAYKETMEMIGAGAWNEEWDKFLVFRAARAFILKAEPLSALPAENKHSLAAGVWLLRHYFERYIGDPFVVMSDSAGPLVERRFLLPLGEVDGVALELFGTIDAVLKNEQTGQILITDHKTTGQLYGFYDRVKPNHQYTAYVLGAQRSLGLSTEDFLVNAIEKKPIPKTAKGQGPQFARQITNRTEEDFSEFLTALRHNVSTFLRLRAQGEYPMTAPGPCGSYAGCQFLEVCGAPRELRESIIQAKYEVSGHVS